MKLCLDPWMWFKLFHGDKHKPPLVLLNAAHTVMGGGLTYLQGIIPELGKSEFRWLLVAPKHALAQIELPVGWTASIAPELNFIGKHIWEQLLLPILARWWGTSVTLCNANYVPIAAPRPLPILHCPTVAGQAQATSLRDSLYWRALHAMTELSLCRSRYAIAIADTADDYRQAQKLRVSDRLFYAPPGRPRFARPSVKDPDLVIAAGNILPGKRYEVLVRSISKLARSGSNVRLEIIGHAFDRSLHGKLSRLIDELNLNDRVTIRGFLEHEQLLHRMSQASALVSASVAEVANLVVLEAMAVGTPVVLADTRAQRNMAGPAGLFVKSDTEDPSNGYAAAIHDVLTDCSKRDALIEAGRRRAEEYGWTSTAAGILEGLRRVVGRASSEESN